ncbi:Rrf2 family transcriptional regulator [Fulvivirga sp. M361]|uniref:RrF2 family transcriptional regulator n=1 Tax=Fulvivirga sp. M361 TaxID=2594266 RepID=UPI001179D618|nr:Rrf2 family transcriptional regulator [Fulvivirga sp. M361]TRX52210.1 Rrf2 family transcriptional regulator [Fulvivirga sp. M361]
MFSKACEYASKIMIYLASKRDEDKLAGLKDIAKAINSPEAYTAKILQQLVRRELLLSVRGPNGGFGIHKNKEVSLMEVVMAIDGEGIVKKCILGLEVCSENRPCPVHDKFVAVRDHLRGILSTTLITEVGDGIEESIFFLK